MRNKLFMNWDTARIKLLLSVAWVRMSFKGVRLADNWYLGIIHVTDARKEE
jgi:hypothetical protein